MIKSFKHKGLKKYFYYGDISGIQAEHRDKIRLILSTIDSAKTIQALDVPMFKLHKLKGNLSEHYSMRVNGNWRITFKFENGDAYILDYQDYH
ncbi:MAG: type II toxin-antitoxin system RelE/ParE family toxin [Candidatus Gastranaerophilales bacterium]|nr:type II toxin-antitoxin system RelE/ParE family toxin [Candidatus Gastranaerophilales bacterium]